MNETIAQILSRESRRKPWEPSKATIDEYVLAQAKQIARGEGKRRDWVNEPLAEGITGEGTDARPEEVGEGEGGKEGSPIKARLAASPRHGRKRENLEDWDRRIWNTPEFNPPAGFDDRVTEIEHRLVSDAEFFPMLKRICCGDEDWAPPVRMRMTDDELDAAIDLATEQGSAYRITLLLAMGFTLSEIKTGTGHPYDSAHVDAVYKRSRRAVPAEKRDEFMQWARTVEIRNSEAAGGA